MPRNIVPALQASETFPASTWASMRRWPSMRVTGSITRRAMSSFLSCFGLFFSVGLRGRFRGGLDHLDQAVTCDAGHNCAGETQAQLGGGNLDAEARHGRQ